MFCLYVAGDPLLRSTPFRMTAATRFGITKKTVNPVVFDNDKFRFQTDRFVGES